MDPVEKLIELALKNRIVRLTYRKTAEEEPTDRLVEPYRTSHNENSMIIRCWQAAPVVVDGAQWRWFRADRIVKVLDGGQNFLPRCQIQLSADEVRKFNTEREAESQAEAVEKYFRHVETAMMDGLFSPEEMAVAKELSMGVPPSKLKVVHGHIFINVLNELLLDGELTPREQKHLEKIKTALAELGWSP
jgi:predicted DNA-binding transcriptional regulator YafY